MNTREYRYRKRLEDERHKLVEKAMKIIPNYHPPSEYRRPTKTQEKVYVPVNDYPEINFSMITNPLLTFPFFFCTSFLCKVMMHMISLQIHMRSLLTSLVTRVTRNFTKHHDTNT